MNLKAIFFTRIPPLALLAAAGCTTPPAPVQTTVVEAPANAPEWIRRPKGDDSLYLYRVGHATGQPDQEAARKAAYQNALEIIAREMVAHLSIEGERVTLASKVTLRNVEIMPGIQYAEVGPDGHSCWVQVSYPLGERAKIVAKINNAEKLNREWGAARAASARGEHETARLALLEILKGATDPEFLSFRPDEAKLLLADTCLAQKDTLEARRWLDSVESTSADPRSRSVAQEKRMELPPPPRFWKMNDRWKGAKVALLCQLREGDGCKPYPDLDAVFDRDCREARLDTVHLRENIDAREAAALFDSRNTSHVVKVARKAGAGVVLALLYDIDPVRRARAAAPGAAPSGPDSSITLLVVRVADEQVIFTANIREVAGSSSPVRLAETAANILIQKYLVPKCPSL
jgi:hypothetical protein